MIICPQCSQENLKFSTFCEKCNFPFNEFITQIIKQDKIENLKTFIENGTILNNYTFLNLIGAGGFGQVYKAQSKFLKREVAIKVYKIKNTHFLQAFHKGVNMISQLNHPNIIAIYDYFIEQDLGFAMIVMELLNPSETLRKYVGNFNSKEKVELSIKWFTQIVSTLRFCHQKRYETLQNGSKLGVYHGDIKPDNIFLHLDNIKLGDFMIPNLEQIDKILEHGYTFDDSATMAFGTPNYMSEEQGINGHVNEQTDIYSLGITIFELLTGFYPYDNYNPQRNRSPKSARQYNPFIPEWLDNILLRCIDDDKQKRYTRVAEVEIDLMK